MRILFFTPLGGRTGSEVVLSNIIRYSDRKAMQMAVASRINGELMKQLPADVHGFVYSQPTRRSLMTKVRDSLHYRIARNTGDRLIHQIHSHYQPDFWYVNTIAQPEVIRQARDYGVPCLVHSHELDHAFYNLRESDIDNLLEYPKLIIACSKAVESTLRVLGRERDLEVCYEMVSIANIESDAEKTKAIRRGLQIDEKRFVWAMSGTLDLNKDPGLFVDLANEVLKSNSQAHFIWLGGSENGYSYFAKQKSRFLGISDRITWLGARTHDYYDHLNFADGFVLVSRRDSFPLVMIEAAFLGKPIASFNSGGIREFVLPGMGTVVDSWNVSDLARAMLKIMNRETDFEPQIARERAKQFDAPLQVKHWENIIHKYFG